MRDFRHPQTLPPKLREGYATLSAAFLQLCERGWSPMDVNAFAVGMCRTSMEDIVGKDEAIAMDREWRESIGWSDSEAGGD